MNQLKESNHLSPVGRAAMVQRPQRNVCPAFAEGLGS